MPSSYSALSGNNVHYLISQTNNHLHIVIRARNMMYDKGAIFVYGAMNSISYVGIIRYLKSGETHVENIFGSGLIYSYSRLEDNGETIRIVLNINKYSSYVMQGTDPFETSHTTG